jgi:DNA anti-recombination protein RmuC
MTEAIGNYGGDSSSRLDRIEAILASVAESQALTQALQQHTQQQVDSNARAIAAWESRIEEGIAETEEIATQTRQDLSERIDTQSDRLERVERQSEDDWTRFDQRHEEHAQRFNTLLQEARADRQEWRQRFDEQISEMVEAREANQAEHRAFTQNIQTLLAEIARLWQRLA